MNGPGSARVGVPAHAAAAGAGAASTAAMTADTARAARHETRHARSLLPRSSHVADRGSRSGVDIRVAARIDCLYGHRSVQGGEVARWNSPRARLEPFSDFMAERGIDHDRLRALTAAPGRTDRTDHQRGGDGPCVATVSGIASWMRRSAPASSARTAGRCTTMYDADPKGAKAIIDQMPGLPDGLRDDPEAYDTTFLSPAERARITAAPSPSGTPAAKPPAERSGSPGADTEKYPQGGCRRASARRIAAAQRGEPPAVIAGDGIGGRPPEASDDRRDHHGHRGGGVGHAPVVASAAGVVFGAGQRIGWMAFRFALLSRDEYATPTRPSASNARWTSAISPRFGSSTPMSSTASAATPSRCCSRRAARRGWSLTCSASSMPTGCAACSTRCPSHAASPSCVVTGCGAITRPAPRTTSRRRWRRCPRAVRAARHVPRHQVFRRTRHDVGRLGRATR